MRDLSLMTLHFAVAGREHELAHLRVRDVIEDSEGRSLVVDVRVFKVTPQVVAVPFGSRAYLCPVRAWRRWRAELGLDTAPDPSPSGPCTTAGTPCCPRGWSPRRSATSSNASGAAPTWMCGLTGHSPRRGLVTESSRAGNPDAVMEKQGGWSPGSKVMRRYREAD
ncbi:hypothetical protein AB0I66_41750 [Streptomyces sp. NPDC050439]|uniref:hypothetical protein n=1 Tax=unclassified Streptomyces TaxID=2593676 RepID=UPI00342DC258